MHIEGRKMSYEKFVLDPTISTGVLISDDGSICRNDLITGFGTAISKYGVSKGKWYYECTALTYGSFQVGWVTSEFRPSDEGGTGVGDDKYGWAVDIMRNASWHEDSSGSVTKPYAEGTKLRIGGVMQCFLDLENRQIKYSYNGEFLGIAYEDLPLNAVFHAALSTNLENECFCNFGQKSFVFPQDDEFRPLCESVLQIQN